MENKYQSNYLEIYNLHNIGNKSEILTEGRNMNGVVQILMDRDRNTEQEVIKRFKETKITMEECSFEPIEVEKILMEQLGVGDGLYS